MTTFLVVSPLRALADECRSKWGPSIAVVTPEEWIRKNTYADIVIFDEFHLYFYWGDSFRPIMWEMFFEVSQRAKITLLLTATLSLEMKSEIMHFKSQFDSLIWIDNGNQKLLYEPSQYIMAPDRNWIMNQIVNQKKGDGVKLIFCQYRDEVFALERRLRKLGFTTVSCVGGESKFMVERLIKLPEPDFIISTTVLSHGVNLPIIRKIYFTYKVSNADFWIQMVARGGRRGDLYQVFALEKPLGLKWNMVRNTLEVFWLSITVKFSGQKFFSPFQF